MDIEGFVVALTKLFKQHRWNDIDGGDYQALLIKHGLAIERPATEKDCKLDWASEYGVEVGDSIIVDSEEFSKLMGEEGSHDN